MSKIAKKEKRRQEANREKGKEEDEMFHTIVFCVLLSAPRLFYRSLLIVSYESQGRIVGFGSLFRHVKGKMRQEPATVVASEDRFVICNL